MGTIADAAIRDRLTERVTLLEQAVRALSTARRLEASSLGSGEIAVPGGIISIQSPGRLETRYPSGQVSAWLGPVYQHSSSQAVVADGLVITSDVEDADGIKTTVLSAIKSRDGAMTVGVGSGTSYPVDRYSVFSRDVWLFAGSDDNVGNLKLTADTSIQLYTPETTTASANLVLDATGHLRVVGSSAEGKLDLEDLQLADPAIVLSIRPRTWRDANEVAADPATTTRYVGVVAEELHELGLTQFVLYDHETGTPRSVAYDRLAAGLVPLLRVHHAQLAAAQTRADELAARLDAQEATIAALTARLTALEGGQTSG